MQKPLQLDEAQVVHAEQLLDDEIQTAARILMAESHLNDKEVALRLIECDIAEANEAFCKKRKASNACFARAFAFGSRVAPYAKHSPAPYIAVQSPSLSLSWGFPLALSAGRLSGASAINPKGVRLM